MKPSLNLPLAVALSLVLSTPATSTWAQTAPAPSPSQQDHAAHHPDPNQTSTPTSQPSQGGAMPSMGMTGGQSGEGMTGGGDMGRMMSMMHGGGMMGGMPFEHVEGRLAFLKTELKITPAQEPQWNKFADAIRSAAQSMKGMHDQMMQGGQMMQGAPSAPARLDRYEHMLAARLETVRAIKAAFDPLYLSLFDDQKKTADELCGRMAAM
jgi:hypothetical protein